MLLVGDYSVCT